MPPSSSLFFVYFPNVSIFSSNILISHLLFFPTPQALHNHLHSSLCPSGYNVCLFLLKLKLYLLIVILYERERGMFHALAHFPHAHGSWARSSVRVTGTQVLEAHLLLPRRLGSGAEPRVSPHIHCVMQHPTQQLHHDPKCLPVLSLEGTVV